MSTPAPWRPRLPLTQAEHHVDFPGHDWHIRDRREGVERAARPTVRRLAGAVLDFHGLTPRHQLDRLADVLARALDATARYGHREAQREIRALRAGRPATAAYAVPDAGEYGQQARRGLPGVRELILRRSRAAAAAVAAAANVAAAEPGLDRTERELLIAQAAQRALHNHVLELVGETLNMGRTAGAFGMEPPPEFALRSEQLDKATCDPCTHVHGEIAQLGSSDYFALMPPSYCLGGGRCRGVMVFGDGPIDFRLPRLEAA